MNVTNHELKFVARRLKLLGMAYHLGVVTHNELREEQNRLREKLGLPAIRRPSESQPPQGGSGVPRR